MIHRIETLDALQAVVGKTPPAIHLKVIDHLDDGARRWIAASPLAFLCLADERMVAVTLAGERPGFAEGGESTLRIPLEAVDDPGLFAPGRSVGSLFLAPGIGETLRVNGRVAAVRDGEALVAVEECYVHCAKALIRSEFWKAAPLDSRFADVADFVAASRFMALGTVDAAGGADLSPKGDPPGTMVQWGDGALWFADRPGNRRVDSFRNILSRPSTSALLLVPGSPWIATVAGNASLTDDERIRGAFAVQGKVPTLVTRIDAGPMDVRVSPALQRAGTWPLGMPAEGIDPAAMFVAHMKANKDRSLGARIAGTVVAIPGLMQKGLDRDYEKNLY